MGEIPTVRVDPTHAECDDGCDYAVKDRARAIAEWAETKDARRCSHVLMAEADYVMLKSPPRSVMLQRGHAYGFLFGYIIPWHEDALPASRVLHDVERYGRYEDVPQSGNAPQVMHGDDLRKIAEIWADLVERGEEDETVKRVFGWIRDMYAFDFAATRIAPKPLTIHYPPVPFNKLMAQPPADATAGEVRKSPVLPRVWSRRRPRDRDRVVRAVRSLEGGLRPRRAAPRRARVSLRVHPSILSRLRP
jgi:hypothetical protein